MTRRRLPHLYPENAWLFVTWSLQGSLPPGRFPSPGIVSAGRAFVYLDRYLDTTLIGPQFLRLPEARHLVMEAIQSGSGFEPGPFAVMTNHVHVLIRPRDPASKVLQWLKGSTARSINKLLARTGEPLWQRESYDHWVRNAAEFARIARYIEINPVKAGLAAEPELYRWSSAWRNPEHGLKATPAR
jgi:putative transposase